MRSIRKRQLRVEPLEDRQLLSASPYRDLTSPQTVSGPTVPLFSEGDGGYPLFNIPAIVTTTSGAVLAFAEGRSGAQDPTSYAIVMRRSTDNGETWSAPSAAASIDQSTGGNINGTCPIVDQMTGDIFLLFTKNVSTVFVTKSSDNGVSWSAPTEITASVKVTSAGNPGPVGAYSNDPWDWYTVTPGHGIQLQHGAHAGRLLAGADHRLLGGDGTSFSHVIYSDDHGQTWHLGGGMDASELANANTNECTLVELNNGDVYMNIRMQSDSVPYRADALSTDGGITWTNSTWNFDLPSQSVEGSVLRLNSNVLLLSSLHNVLGDQRHELTIWLSYNEGQDWTRQRTIDFGYAGYSDMTVIGPDTILLVYTRGYAGGQLVGGVPSVTPALTFEEIELAKIDLTWLESADPYQFEWNFNELAPGMTVANDPLPVAQDSGPWDQKGIIYGVTSPPVQYVAGPGADSALRLTSGDDEVVLSQGDSSALQFDLNDGYTIEVDFRTTDTDGILIGSRPTVKNWTLALVGGHVQYSVFDGTHTSSITSDGVVSDGNWHELVVIHDPISRKMKLIVDGYGTASVLDTNTIARTAADPLDPVVLGAYSTMDPSSQLAVDVDRVRITRSVLDSSQFLLNSVVGRHLFYAGSRWDTPNHDNAIAPDKSAYLPGYGAASFSTVSSYTKGINGLMVDITGAHGPISADDFFFRVGNNNSPSLWGAATAPLQVAVRSGAGVGGSDRIDILWADNAIRGRWLEVIVRGNDSLGGFHGNAGLADSDVFFFGSAPADSGVGDNLIFVTNSIDEQSARNDPHSATNRATITNPNDFNRDGLVNTIDQQMVRNNLTNGATALRRINLAGVGPFAPIAAQASPTVAIDNITGAEPKQSWSVGAITLPREDADRQSICLALADAEPSDEYVREWIRLKMAGTVKTRL